jgi:hypothetical protein
MVFSKRETVSSQKLNTSRTHHSQSGTDQAPRRALQSMRQNGYGSVTYHVLANRRHCIRFLIRAKGLPMRCQPRS